jgi:AbrB family looped-hinge helix DNA binding protein
MAQHSNTSNKQCVVIQLGDRGRLVLPAQVRHELGLEAGDRLVVRACANGVIELEPWDVHLGRLMGSYADFEPGRILSEELIAERRAEAARDDAE